MITMPSMTLHSPTRLDDLNQGERLLVWSLRAMASGHGDCLALQQTFEHLCGRAAGPAALQAWFTVVQLMGMTSRRRLKVHAPGCMCVSFDETALIGLVAAAQRALDGDDDLLRMRLSFLVRPESAETMRYAALAVARLLAYGEVALPVRLGEAILRVPEPAKPLRAVH